MQRLPRFQLILCALALLAGCGKPASAPTGTDASASARAELEQLMTVFPSMYWYASDACMRETSRAPGQLGTPEEFAAANKASINKVETNSTPDGQRIIAEIDLLDPKEPNEHFVFQFIYENDRWNASTAYKYMGAARYADLYEADIFMGSMKPYIQKGLAAFDEKKDYKEVYKAK